MTGQLTEGGDVCGWPGGAVCVDGEGDGCGVVCDTFDEDGELMEGGAGGCGADVEGLGEEVAGVDWPAVCGGGVEVAEGEGGLGGEGAGEGGDGGEEGGFHDGKGCEGIRMGG